MKVADIEILSARYRIDSEELRELLDDAEQRGAELGRLEFQGVEIWEVARTDGWFVRLLREQAQVRQSDLGDELSCSQSHLARIERGDRECPFSIDEVRVAISRVVQERPAETAA